MSILNPHHPGLLKLMEIEHNRIDEVGDLLLSVLDHLRINCPVDEQSQSICHEAKIPYDRKCEVCNLVGALQRCNRFLDARLNFVKALDTFVGILRSLSIDVNSSQHPKERFVP